MDEKEIKALAALARIRITENEIPKVAGKLTRVLEYVSLIQKAHAPDAKTPDAGELRNVMREDGIPHESGAYTEEILANVPSREGDYVKVKKIL